MVLKRNTSALLHFAVNYASHDGIKFQDFTIFVGLPKVSVVWALCSKEYACPLTLKS